MVLKINNFKFTEKNGFVFVFVIEELLKQFCEN